MLKEILKNPKAIISILMMALVIAIGVDIVNASSSITYSNFQNIAGNNIMPISPILSYGTQVQTPVVSATAGAGSLTGGRIDAVVVATTLYGTSTPSNEIATTTAVSSSLQLTWPTIPNATAYAIYIGTSTPGSEQAYFEATSTSGAVNTYYTLTSTSSPTYNVPSYTGSGFLNSIGSGTSTITSAGPIMAVWSATTTACTTTLNGEMVYSTANQHLWLCQGSGPTWTLIK